MFQEDFKYYKSRTKQPSMSNVIDFGNNSTIINNDNIRELPVPQSSCTPDDLPSTTSVTSSTSTSAVLADRSFGLRRRSRWRAYTVTSHPGFAYVTNPFTERGRRYWCARSLRDYTRKPNKSNVDNLDLLGDGEDWWTATATIIKSADKSAESPRQEILRRKMRWVTLGYHHNWDTKQYDYEHKNEFPADLHALCRHIAGSLGVSDCYSAEAAILNFYSEGDTLAGHTDHSEPHKEAPLISLSFGRPAVFLLGGHTKDTKPLAILVKSGDISILSGYSRLCYHAVPRVFKENLIDNSLSHHVDDKKEMLRNIKKNRRKNSKKKYAKTQITTNDGKERGMVNDCKRVKNIENDSLVKQNICNPGKNVSTTPPDNSVVTKLIVINDRSESNLLAGIAAKKSNYDGGTKDDSCTEFGEICNGLVNERATIKNKEQNDRRKYNENNTSTLDITKIENDEDTSRNVLNEDLLLSNDGMSDETNTGIICNTLSDIKENPKGKTIKINLSNSLKIDDNLISVSHGAVDDNDHTDEFVASNNLDNSNMKENRDMALRPENKGNPIIRVENFNDDDFDDFDDESIVRRLAANDMDAEIFRRVADDSEFWRPYGEYLSEHRLNLNVRQVLFETQNIIDDTES